MDQCEAMGRGGCLCQTNVPKNFIWSGNKIIFHRYFQCEEEMSYQINMFFFSIFFLLRCSHFKGVIWQQSLYIYLSSSNNSSLIFSHVLPSNYVTLSETAVPILISGSLLGVSLLLSCSEHFFRIFCSPILSLLLLIWLPWNVPCKYIKMIYS